MAETKTKPTGASIDAYLASRASPEQLADCKALMAMCKRVTKQQPKMWGPSIVGYGSYTYRYETGHSGNACLTGFAVRGKDLVVYVVAESPAQVATYRGGKKGTRGWFVGQVMKKMGGKANPQLVNTLVEKALDQGE